MRRLCSRRVRGLLRWQIWSHVYLGKGTWLQVAGLIKHQEWNNIFLITDKFGKDNFKPDKKSKMVVIDPNKRLTELVEDIRKSLDRKLGIDVAVNLISGTGKEHMAVMSALLKLGAGIRLIALTKEGISEV